LGQLRRPINSPAALNPSHPNIAEGYGRGFGRDGSRFLRIARGSAAELESHLWIARGTGRIPAKTVDDLTRRVRRVRALIQGLSRYFESGR
jgi:four helix bundle protein